MQFAWKHAEYKSFHSWKILTLGEFSRRETTDYETTSERQATGMKGHQQQEQPEMDATVASGLLHRGELSGRSVGLPADVPATSPSLTTSDFYERNDDNSLVGSRGALHSTERRHWLTFVLLFVSPRRSALLWSALFALPWFGSVRFISSQFRFPIIDYDPTVERRGTICSLRFAMDGRQRGTQLLIVAHVCFLFFAPPAVNADGTNLMFPPPRMGSLEVFDVPHLPGICGVPKPSVAAGVRTDLQNGHPFNLTWSSDIPAKDGYKVELLSSDETVQYMMSIGADKIVDEPGSRIKNYEIKLPTDFLCEGCILRLSHTSDQEQFFNGFRCADINIRSGHLLPCSGHGTVGPGDSCQCEKFYSGIRCEKKDDCQSDADCGNSHGRCMTIEKRAVSVKKCYCSVGWFGPRCDIPSQIKSRDLDLSQYQKRDLSGKEVKLYWRIIEERNEIEIVVQSPSNEWMAVGIRSEDTLKKCGNISRILRSDEESATTVYISSATDRDVFTPLPEITPTERKVEFITEFQVSPDTRNTTVISTSTSSYKLMENTTTSERVTSTLQSSQPVTTTTTTQLPSVLLTTHTVAVSSRTSETPLSLVQLQTVAGVRFVTEIPISVDVPIFLSEDSGPIIGDVCYGEWHYPAGCTDCQFRASWTYIDEIDSIEFTLAANMPEESWTGIGFLSNNKNDVDMIVVRSHGNQLSVTDMNAASPTSTPKLDAEQNLVLPEVVGMHENGVLRATFVRPRTTNDLTNDVQFTDDDCFNFVFPAHSGRLDANGNIDALTKPPVISREKVCVRSCAAKTFTKNCQQEYRFPAGCIPPSCEYFAVWSFDPSSGEITFHISSKEVGRWTGIGFSETGSMMNSDVIVGWVHENMTYVTDRFAYGKHMPAIDKQQNINNIQGRIENGMQTLVFSRKRNTTDIREDISLEDCVYFLFPVGGGRLLARSPSDYHDSNVPIGFHDMYIPKVSSEPICVCSEDEVAAQLRRKRQVSTALTKRSLRESEVPVLDCADVMLSSAFDHLGKVEDHFVLSGGLPEIDNNFGGHQSMTGALAYAENGITTTVFRRKIMPTELTDNAIANGPMTLFWLTGPLNTTEGRAPRWGALSVNFFVQVPAAARKRCWNEFVMPKRCSATACRYNVTWVRHEKNVQFILDVSLSPSRWTGIGFSKTGQMPGSDAVIVAIKDDGHVEVTDQFLAGRTSPVVDKIQNIFNIDAQYINGRVKASFFRSLKTDDASQDLDLNDCVYLLFPDKGGQLDLMGNLKMHDSIPINSEKLVCFNECRTDFPVKKGGTNMKAERIQKPLLSYLMTFRVLNRNLTERPSGQNLHEEIEKAVDSVMKQKLTGYSEVKLSKLWGNLFAEVNISASDTNRNEILSVALPAARNGMYGQLAIDADSISVKEVPAKYRMFDEIRDYVIILVICLFVLIAIIFTSIMIWRTRRRSSKNINYAVQYPPPFSCRKNPSEYGYNLYPDFRVGYPMPVYSENRQYSNAATATSSPRGTGEKREPSGAPPNVSPSKLPPPTSYNEWLNKINPADPQMTSSGNGPRQLDPESKPYVTYPNDPYSYYTLNGSTRMSSR